MLKNTNKPVIILTLLILLLFTSAHTSSAQEDYKLLAPIGSLETVSIGGSNFSGYLQRIINIAIGSTAAIAVLMLIIGGVQYVLSSVSETAKKDAKDRITNAILGIILVLSGYLILNTINPDLINLGLPKIKPLERPATPTPGTGTPTPPGGRAS